MKVLDSMQSVGRVRDRVDYERPRWERLQNIGLAVLGVVAVVGIVIAFQAPDPGTDPLPTTTPTDSASVTDEPSESPSEEPTTPVETNLISVLVDQEGTTRMRAPVVECQSGLEPVVIQVAADGGPWQPTLVPDLVTITGLQVVGGDFMRVVGHDAECTPASYVSRDGGATWSPAASEVRFWSILPENDKQVATPTGAVKVPCAPRAVSAINGTVARVWCETGQIVGTADAGAHWVALGSLSDAESIAYLDAADGVALALDPECQGVSVLITRDGGSDWETKHCAEITGPWGVIATPTTITVIGSDAAETSEDVGETWSAS